MPKASRSAAISWDDLRAALAVARRRSHGGAARTLGVDRTTVARRIEALEAGLDVALFERTPAGLEPTTEGRALIARAQRAEEEILAAQRELGGADARLAGTVRLSASDGVVHYVLIPALVDLRRSHPEITVELLADSRTVNLSRREADVAIRLVKPSEPALVSRRWGAVRFALYASASYLELRGAPRAVADLAAHDLVGFDASHDDLEQVRWLRKLVPRPRWAIRASSTTAQVAACAEGLGVALLGTFAARREPRLRPLLPAVRPPAREAFVVFHQDLRENARVIATRDWLSRIEREAAL